VAPRLVNAEPYYRTERGGWRKARGLLEHLSARTIERHRDCESGRFLPRTARVTGCGPAVCYASRRELGLVLLEWLKQRYGADTRGGAGHDARGGGFDAVNERYNLRGRRRVGTLAAAVGACLPRERPWCLDRVDMETLNDTAPAREAGGFELPDAVHERRALMHQAELFDDDDTSADDVPF
jgi:hypothetical protein